MSRDYPSGARSRTRDTVHRKPGPWRRMRVQRHLGHVGGIAVPGAPRKGKCGNRAPHTRPQRLAQIYLELELLKVGCTLERCPSENDFARWAPLKIVARSPFLMARNPFVIARSSVSVARTMRYVRHSSSVCENNPSQALYTSALCTGVCHGGIRPMTMETRCSKAIFPNYSKKERLKIRAYRR